jgi:hypothetical protein
MNKTQRITTRLDDVLFRAVRTAAKQERKNVGEFTRLILERDEAVRAILNETKPKTKGTK